MQEQLFINIKADSRGSAAFKVYNSKGQLVKKQNNGLLPGSNLLVVGVAHLITGLYHVEVISTDGTRKAMTIAKK